MPRPAYQVLDVTKSGGGEDDPLSGHIVHWVFDVTEVTHRPHVPHLYHHLVVVVSREVSVVDLHHPVASAAHDAGPVPREAAHHVRHCDPVVGDHPGHLEHGKYLPIGH